MKPSLSERSTSRSSVSRSGKPVTWERVRRNLKRMARHSLPPVLHPLLGLASKDRRTIARPSTQSERLASQPEPVEFQLPVESPDRIWPEFDQTPIVMFPRQLRHHLWAMPENELMVLATICRLLQPRQVFEFGTFTGASTLAIAANSHPDVQVHTLDIPPQDRKSHRTGMGNGIPFDFEIGEVFRQTRYEERIQIHLQDARLLDTEPFANQMDLVFIDADHTYEFVRNDTEKALRMLKPGGCILWHDYRWDETAPECAGVTRWVSEFYQAEGHCHEIGGTRFAIYHSPSSTQQKAVA